MPTYDAVKAAAISPDDRWVVVDSAARLYLDREGTRWLEGSAPTDDCGMNTAGFAMVDRGHDNGRARLLIAPFPDDVCLVDHALGESALAFTVYVDPDALRRVTTVAVEQSFADGTSVRVQPGVPVFGSPGGKTHTVLSVDLGVDLELAETVVGTHFTPAPALNVGETNAWPSTPANAVRFAGDRELQDIRPLAHRRIIADRHPDGGFAVRVDSDCLSLDGRIDDVYREPQTRGDPEIEAFPKWHDLSSLVSPDQIHDDIPPRPPPVSVVDRGSPLYLDDGTAVGMVRQTTRLSSEVPAPPDLRCFKLATRLGTLLPLCLDAHDVREVDEFWTDRREPTKRAPAAVAFRGLTEVDGALGVREVRQVLSQHAATVASCYQPALARDGTLDGEVRAWMIVDSDGRVERAGTLDPREPGGVDHPRADRCLAEQLETLRFGVGPAYVVQNFALDSVRP